MPNLTTRSAITTVDPTDLLYVLTDPAGTPGDAKIEFSDLQTEVLAGNAFTGRTITGTANHITVTNGDGVSGNPTLDLGSRITTDTRSLTIDGGGSTITTGRRGAIEIPFTCTITAVRVFADQTGSIVLDIWKDTYTNYPPTIGDSITASAKPTISSATKSEDTTLAGWTLNITAGDVLVVYVDSCTSITQATISLTLAK
jgi:hypothetical protein